MYRHFRHEFFSVIFAGSALFLAGLGGLTPTPAMAAQAEQAGSKSVIVVGRVSKNPRTTYPRLEKLSDYLAKRLRAGGIKKGGVVIARNNKEMLDHLRGGKVDFISESVMSALLFEKEAGAQILLREWKKSKAWYWSVIFVRRAGHIGGLADLRGKKIAFEDRGSTTGFLLPLAILRQHGLDPVELKNTKKNVPGGKVGYVFATNELNITAWVVRKKVHAGAFSNTDWEWKGRAPRSMRKDLKIIYKSRPMVRSLFLARGDLSASLKDSVVKILTQMNKDKAGKRVLRSYYKVKKYDEIKGEVEESLDESRKLFDLVRDQVN